MDGEVAIDGVGGGDGDGTVEGVAVPDRKLQRLWPAGNELQTRAVAPGTPGSVTLNCIFVTAGEAMAVTFWIVSVVPEALLPTSRPFTLMLLTLTCVPELIRKPSKLEVDGLVPCTFRFPTDQGHLVVQGEVGAAQQPGVVADQDSTRARYLARDGEIAGDKDHRVLKLQIPGRDVALTAHDARIRPAGSDVCSPGTTPGSSDVT